MQLSKPLSILFSFFVFSLFSCSEATQKQTDENHLGEIHFKVTGNTDAQPFFEEGLLLLHSFEFEDARLAFQKAQEIDSNFVMAYWGEAMTYNHPLWRSQDYADARAVLDAQDAKAEKILSEKGTEIERDLWQSLKVLYAEEGDKKTRDKAYSEYLASLYEKYPESHEIAAFYALSILAAVPVGRDETEYEKGAKIAEGILKENPKHPGALHYLIHSYDDPSHAQLALNAANNYSKVAPDAAHALHMPSHIFVALGMWEDVVVSNIASYQASVNRMNRKELDNDARNYHALHWLQYGYLQQGKRKAAQKLLEDMKVYSDTLPSKRARRHLVYMKGTYLAETDDWSNELANLEIDLEELNIVSHASVAFIEGMKAFKNGDRNSIKQLIDQMESDRGNAAMFVSEGGAPMCGSSSRYQPNQLDIGIAHVFEMELRALLAQLQNDKTATEDWLKKACELQVNISYTYGPPVIIKTAFEMYGEWLLEQNRPDEALLQFEKAWERGPNRARILDGKIKAYQLKGDEENTEKMRKELAKNWKGADDDLKNKFLNKDQYSDKSI